MLKATAGRRGFAGTKRVTIAKVALCILLPVLAALAGAAVAMLRFGQI